MSELKIKGQIEVVLEDKNGNVLRREVKDNTITRAGLRYFLFQMMQASNISNVTRILQGAVTGTALTQFGIYAMSTPVDVKRDAFRPPYVDNSGLALHPDVTFYNLNGATSETATVMIPNDIRCHMTKDDRVEYVMEYVKNTGVGTINSVVIGKVFTLDTQYVIHMRDHEMPVAAFDNLAAHYLLEHTADGTILHKNKSTTNQLWSANLKTKEFEQRTNSNQFAVLASYYGGLIVNDALFKVAKLSSGTSGSNYNVNLTCIPNWKTSSAVRTITIPFTTREGMSIDTVMLPLLVSRPGENILEIFLTTSIGEHPDGKTGANVQKAIVDVSDVDNITWEFEDMGVLPYAISSHGTSVGQYVTGYFDGQKYYLPFYYRVAGDGTHESTVAASLMEGVVLSADFQTEYKTVCIRPASNQFAAFVQSDVDEVLQCVVNTTGFNYVDTSQLLSGTNLTLPITKGEDQILRVFYRYKLS